MSKKIIMFPPLDGKAVQENRYLSLMAQALQESGYDVLSFSFANLLRRKQKDCKNYQLNWYENCPSLKQFLGKLFVLFVLMVNRKKIFFVMHNKRVHADHQSFLSAYYSKILFYLLLRWSYKIVIHSQDSVNYIKPRYHAKVIYIPHPNYIQVYGSVEESNGSVSESLNLLFLGSIREYKNIELLIDVVAPLAGRDVLLTIAGSVKSPAYKKELVERIGTASNIKPLFRFIEEEEMPGILAQCDLLVLPYDVKSSLNSGAAILAFSYKRSVISPVIGTLKDMHSKCFFSYEYADSEEHKAKLTAIIQEAVCMKKENPAVFEEWGECMHKDVQDNNSIELISKLISSLY